MNKLWIRIQGNREKTKREKERIDLKVTVGENLHRLSALEGVNMDIYQNVVLPKMLELVGQFLKLIYIFKYISIKIDKIIIRFNFARISNRLHYSSFPR